MNRLYEYRGYMLDVSVESVCYGRSGRSMLAYRRYEAVVQFAAHDASTLDLAGPTLRLVEAGGLPFASEVDALMGGYSAAQRVIDERLRHAQCRLPLRS